MAVEPTLAGAALTVPLVSADGYTVRVQSATGNTFDIRRNSDGTVDMRCAQRRPGRLPRRRQLGRSSDRRLPAL